MPLFTRWYRLFLGYTLLLLPDLVCAGPGAEQFANFVESHIINQALAAFYGITAAGIFYMGFKTIMESDKDQAYSDLNSATLNMFIGFGVIGTASLFANTLTTGGFSGSATSVINTGAFTLQIGNVARFMRNLSFALFILLTTISGAQIVAKPGDDGEVTKQKNIIVGSCIGVVVMIIAQAIITIAVTGSPEALIIEFRGIALFVLTFIGFLSGAALIVASIFLIISVDEGLQGKAKTIIIETLIALLITIVAYGLIVTFVPENRFALSIPSLSPYLFT